MLEAQERIFEEVDKLLRERKSLPVITELGFFSKPFRLNFEGSEVVVKTYRPTSEKRFLEELVEHHDAYAFKLRELGVLVPETIASIRELNGKFVLALIQEPFTDNELLRGTMMTCDADRYVQLFEEIFEAAIAFCKARPDDHSIGFHPTLRNYAVRNEELWYFDTFPPMLCGQPELNRLILRMAPVSVSPWKIIPNSWVNRVSNEYYQADKMLIGIVGSSCRLRPEFKELVLEKAKEIILGMELLPNFDKDDFLQQLENPPGLSGLWRFVRAVFGKEGAPNVK